MSSKQEILNKPRFSTEEVETIAQQHFNVLATATELAGERDQNFLLAGEQNQWILKIANSQTDPKILELENAAIGIVAALDAIESPGLNKSIGGSTIVSIATADNQTCFARMLSFVPGVPLSKFRPHSTELFIAIGRALGEVDIELASLNSQRSARRSLHWDLARGEEIVSRISTDVWR